MNSHSERVQISVVIPTYNYGHFLPEAIESALDQTFAPFEIIVADDGSTDNTAEVAARYAPRVSYHRYEHQGVYSVRTRILEAVQSEWFVNLDADNRLDKDFIKHMAEVVRLHNDDELFAFAYPDMRYFGGRNGTVERPEFDPQLLKRGNYIDMNSAIRASVARKFGFDPSFNKGQGDYDFFLTLAKNGYKGVHVPGALLHYRVHAGSIAQKAVQKRRQREIMKRILRKHADYFSPAEATRAMEKADNRLLVALINSRSPTAEWWQRLRDWLYFARAGYRHAEFLKQTRYCFLTKWYFISETSSPDVFYLFRDTQQRRDLVKQITNNDTKEADGGQLFGFDVLRRHGCKIDCNLLFPRLMGIRDKWHGWIDRRYAARTGIGKGDVRLVRSFLWQMKRAKVIVTTADNVGLPASALKYKKRYSSPLIYVSIGLPERLRNVAAICGRRAERYRRQLASVDCFIAYGYGEAKWLKEWLGAGADVRFVPFGVETDYFDNSKITQGSVKEVDVLSVGADPQRDYALLISVAKALPEISFRVVTTRVVEPIFSDSPRNIEILCDISLDSYRSELAAAKLVVLPVKQNSYTGATTTLLQAMALKRPVIVTRTDAIYKGYGLENGKNCILVNPDDESGLIDGIRNLLKDTDKAERIGASAGRHVREYLTWEHYVQRISAIIEEFTSSTNMVEPEI